MNNNILNKNDEIVMKLIHYFMTVEDYSPIVLKGAKDEIWLEKMDGDYRIIRIASNYIHNFEQLEFDIYRTSEIMKRIKKKTMSLNINALNIFTNLGENVDLEELEVDNIDCASIVDIKDLEKYEFIEEEFPGLVKKLTFKEKGMDLFSKLTKDITKKSENDAMRNEEVFSNKKPIITYSLILINVIVFILLELAGGSTNSNVLINFGANYKPLVLSGEIYRLVTSAFLHIGMIHLLFNMYALYIIGPQVESFFGKFKFILIYLFSAISGNLLSMLFTNGISAGASGAIFGLLGAILYFGYHYRVYLDGVIKSQIIPLILINLVIGFSTPGIDNGAHIGGLIGGVLMSIAVGVKYKSTKFEKMNGWIILAIYTGFLVYMSFFGLK